MKIQEWDDEAQEWIDIEITPQAPQSCKVSFGEAALQFAGRAAAQYLPDALKEPLCGIYEEYIEQKTDNMA